MKISRVDASTLDYVWQSLRPQIQSALSKGAGQHMTEAHYFEQVKTGAMVMWVGHEGDQIIAGGILSIQQHPAQTALFVELLAGKNIDQWLSQVEPLLHEFKQAVGATTIEALCRPGLAKKLTRWSHKASLMELK